MQLTIDSGDDLNRVLEAVGGMFGVRVQLAPAAGQDTTSQEPAAVVESTGAGHKPAPADRRATKIATRRAPSGTASRGRRGPASKSGSRNSKPSTAQVRQWAREAGLKVSDRGRVPASVLEAYQTAH